MECKQAGVKWLCTGTLLKSSTLHHCGKEKGRVRHGGAHPTHKSKAKNHMEELSLEDLGCLVPLSSGHPRAEEFLWSEGQLGFQELNNLAWRCILGPDPCWMYVCGGDTRTCGVSCSKAGLGAFAFARIQGCLGQRLRVGGMGPREREWEVVKADSQLSLQTLKMMPVPLGLDRG